MLPRLFPFVPGFGHPHAFHDLTLSCTDSAPDLNGMIFIVVLKCFINPNLPLTHPESPSHWGKSVLILCFVRQSPQLLFVKIFSVAKTCLSVIKVSLQLWIKPSFQWVTLPGLTLCITHPSLSDINGADVHCVTTRNQLSHVRNRLMLPRWQL